MNLREQFTESELAQAKAERATRDAANAIYKKEWYDSSRNHDRKTLEGRAAHNAYMKDWRVRNKDRAKQISREGSARYVAKNPATRRLSARQYNQRKRDALLAFFGGACIRCGFADPRALQLDHIDGDGYKVRGKETLTVKWKMTRDEPERARARFQLLCANCHCIKGSDNYEWNKRSRLLKAVEEAEAK